LGINRNIIIGIVELCRRQQRPITDCLAQGGQVTTLGHEHANTGLEATATAIIIAATKTTGDAEYACRTDPCQYFSPS
jgi:hypothetical protein